MLPYDGRRRLRRRGSAGVTAAAARRTADLVFVELTNARVSWLSVARKDSIFLRFSQDGVGASSKSTTAKLNEHEKSH